MVHWKLWFSYPPWWLCPNMVGLWLNLKHYTIYVLKLKLQKQSPNEILLTGYVIPNIPILPEASLTFASKSFFGPSYASNEPYNWHLSEENLLFHKVAQFLKVLRNVQVYCAMSWPNFMTPCVIPLENRMLNPSGAEPFEVLERTRNVYKT